MDGLPARPSFVLICLKLGTIIWFVEDKRFAVGTKGLLFLWFLGLIHSRSRSRGWAHVPPGGSVLLVCPKLKSEQGLLKLRVVLFL